MLSKNQLKTILSFFLLIIFMYFGSFPAKAACKHDDISKLYEMIYSPLIPFQPPVDEEGNVSAPQEEIFMKRSQHYFDQLKEKEQLRLPLETYAVLTREVPQALLNFETKLRIVLPDCQEITMYNGAPIGQIASRFDVMIKVASIGIDSELEQITNFASKSMKPTPMPFGKIMKVLSNDLSLKPEVISALMPEPIKDRYFPGGSIPVANLSEASLLTFAALGGIIHDDLSKADVPDRLFLIVPKSYSGISENYSSIIFDSYGNMLKIAALNVDLAAQVLVRLGIQVDVVTLKEVITESEGTCGIDPAGRWFQLIQGRKIRTCPFFTMTEQMFTTGSYIETQDFVDQNTVFRAIDKIIKRLQTDQLSSSS